MLTSHPIITKAMTSLTGFTAGDLLAQFGVEKKTCAAPRSVTRRHAARGALGACAPLTCAHTFSLAVVRAPGSEWDWNRTAKMATFGAAWHGPSGHFFYGFLDAKMPGTAVQTVASKVIVDQVRRRRRRASVGASWLSLRTRHGAQVFWNPIFGTVFFTYLNFWEGKSFDDLKKKLEQDLMTAVTASWGCARARVARLFACPPFLRRARGPWALGGGGRYWIPAHIVNFRFIPGEQRLLYINCMQIMCAPRARARARAMPAAL